ncbi:hypothetical protein [Paramuribaculum intestinale]|uniref:ABC transporter permease n=2 Tax=Paramuribaculum intestinale TaxID=2094151 RepID=A0A2V1IT94_9BACT|nr:hypothetical protein [Paramuribaculum intestinale]PWB07858.1 hypothetical protein C5O25_05710 [Paramuribaculum intestinale]PWB08250.1 hypothetical protein C5O24_08445 [Paramuribaculum intestinale]ROS92032.1 ABC transporter permease [Muribaculaceae bacterium Isolate-043 (Harlan)]WLT42837.1 ABC transporter permease [Paramuribaculum intestinale]
MTTDRRILGQLLRRNISIGQLAAFAASSLIGLVIISTAVRFYTDITAPAASDGATDFLVISHGVKGLGSLTDGTDGFSADEIDRLRRQPWVKRLGTFTTAGFSVSAGIDIGPGNGMSTALFLESLPDEFVDADPSQWHYTPGVSETVPIVISKDYLALYNFGFAASRGLPQISDTMSGLLPINLTVSGNGLRHTFKARIAGFSNRLNTIAVPQSFMDWANGIYADAAAPRTPSRIMVETTNPGDPAIKTYLSDNGYELGGDKAFGGRASQIAGVLTAIVIGVGIVIVLLSFGLLLLSVWLLLYKNRYTTTLLMLEGYSPAQISGYYIRLIATVNAILLVIAVVAMTAISRLWSAPLAGAGITGGSPLTAIACAAAITLLLTAGALIAVRRTIIRSFSPRH